MADFVLISGRTFPTCKKISFFSRKNWKRLNFWGRNVLIYGRYFSFTKKFESILWKRLTKQPFLSLLVRGLFKTTSKSHEKVSIGEGQNKPHMNLDNWISKACVHSLYDEPAQRYAETTPKRSFRFRERCLARIPAVKIGVAPDPATTHTRHNDTSIERPARKAGGWNSHGDGAAVRTGLA